jgi:hypothetical protein
LPLGPPNSFSVVGLPPVVNYDRNNPGAPKQIVRARFCELESGLKTFFHGSGP